MSRGYGYDQQPSNPYGGNSYGQGQQQYGGGQGYGGGAGNYEMGHLNGGGAGEDYSAGDFYSEIDQIQGGIDSVNANISRVEQLHSRALQDIDEQNSAHTQRQLESIVAETSALNSNLATRIKKLKGKAGRDPSKGPQVGNLDRKFKEAIRNYQMVEKTFADRTRDQMARQYRIVRPDASEEEVRAACEDSQGQQVFSQALLSGNRRGEARSALREVQSRHNEIQKIEKTMIELAQLFQEMEQLVTEQEPMIEQIDQRGEEVVVNVEKANEEIVGAVEKARSRRRKKWWCLLIIVLLIIAAVVIALIFTVGKKATNA